MTANDSLNITIVVSYSYPYIGSGIGNVAQKQAELLAKAGHHVTLLSSNFPQSDTEFTRHHVHYIKFSASYILEKVHVPVPITFLSLKSIQALAASDIIHIHDGMYLSSFWAAIWGKLFRKKVIVTVHINHIEYPNKFINILERLAAFFIANPVFFVADKIILINNHLEKELKNFAHKIVVLSNGVDTALFHPVSVKERQALRQKHGVDLRKKIVLFVGRLVPKKGYHLLIEARSPKYEIVFVGTGKAPEHVQGFSGLTFIGPKEQEELAEFYQLADVLVLPSHGEGYPLSIKESIASGLPVLTTFTHSTLHTVKQTWFHHIEPSVADIKEKLEEVFSLKGKSNEEKRKVFLEQFDWQKNTRDLLAIYASVISK